MVASIQNIQIAFRISGNITGTVEQVVVIFAVYFAKMADKF